MARGEASSRTAGGFSFCYSGTVAFSPEQHLLLHFGLSWAAPAVGLAEFPFISLLKFWVAYGRSPQLSELSGV